MKVLKEVTTWTAEFAVPNHTYFVSDNKEKVYAYQKQDTTEIFEFKNPYNFNTKGRKFVEIPNVFKFRVDDEPEQKSQDKTWIVKGSKGDEYTVTQVGNKLICSCPGSKYRGKCKHTVQIKI